MRRHITFLAALALAVSMGCATGATGGQHGRMGAVSPGQFHTIPAGYDPSVSGWPGAVGDIVQNAGSLSAWVRSGVNDTDWQAFPGSGGSGTSGFGAHVAISQPDSTNAAVSTLDLQNTETTNTHNSVTAAWLMTFPVGGVQIVGDIMSLNSAARGNVNTVSATPTVAFPPRASALRITFGVAATKVVITGLDLATDLGYDFAYWFPASPGAEVDLKLNDTDATATPSIRGNISAASLAADFSTNLWLADGTRGAVNGMAQLRDMGSGLAKGYWVNAQDTNFRHDYFGKSTLTANVTSASLAGIPINSTLTITRILPSVY